MRCLRGLADLAPRAVALVDEAGGLQPIDGIPIQIETVGLADDLAIPVEADAAQRGELIGLVGQRRCHPVEIFHAHDEIATAMARHQPGDERRPEVAEVQRTRRGRGKSASHRPILTQNVAWNKVKLFEIDLTQSTRSTDIQLQRKKAQRGQGVDGGGGGIAD